jgi:hypothetical protein
MLFYYIILYYITVSPTIPEKIDRTSTACLRNRAYAPSPHKSQFQSAAGTLPSQCCIRTRSQKQRDNSEEHLRDRSSERTNGQMKLLIYKIILFRTQISIRHGHPTRKKARTAWVIVKMQELRGGG